MQTAWIHTKVFKLMDANNKQRGAGKLAINVKNRALPPNDEELKKQVRQLMIVLWMVKNLRANEVGALKDAPPLNALIARPTKSQKG